MSVRVFLERVNWGGKTGTHADGAWTGKKETRGKAGGALALISLRPETHGSV